MDIDLMSDIQLSECTVSIGVNDTVQDVMDAICETNMLKPGSIYLYNEDEIMCVDSKISKYDVTNSNILRVVPTEEWYARIKLKSLNVSITGENFHRYIDHGSNLDVIRLFCQLPDMINYKFDGNVSPLGCALMKGNVEVVRVILASNHVDVNQEYDGGFSPIFLTLDNIKLFNIMLEAKGVDINHKTDDGSTILAYMCISSSVEMLKRYLECDVDINCVDNNGLTALMRSTYYPMTKTYEYLKNYEGVDVDFINHRGESVHTLEARWISMC